MILSENGLWVVALLFLTVFLSASTIRNTRNLIIKVSCFDLSISEQYYGFNSATELQSFQMDSKPHWRRLVFTILRRKQNSLMDQSLAFCLFLSGVRKFLFSGSYRNHIFNAFFEVFAVPTSFLANAWLLALPPGEVMDPFKVSEAKQCDQRFSLRSRGATSPLWHPHLCKVSQSYHQV